VGEPLPGKHKALSSIPRTDKKKTLVPIFVNSLIRLETAVLGKPGISIS
jgi:hypothetical protein